MKKTFKLLAKFISILYKILPFLIGLRCYYSIFSGQQERLYPLLDAIYASIKLYYGTTEGGVPVDWALELARFMALAATLSILISIFNKMSELADRIKLGSGRATVVYGNSAYADYVYASLNRRSRIRGEKNFISGAARYLIMFSNDKRSLEFFSQNYSELKNKNVYIMLDSVSRQNAENPLVTVFSIAENCARQYWRKYPPEKSEKIAMIGFGSVGQNILIYGLQMNLIDPNQHFEYHIYGDGSEFRREHTELDKMLPDEVIFYDDGVYKYEDMSGFDRIIVCGESGEENISVLSRLFVSAPVSGQIYLYAPSSDAASDLFGNDRVVCFGMAKENASIDMILNERSMEAAKRQNEFYRQKYGGVPWEKLDSFKRYSNVSSSDYMYVVNRLVKQGVPFEKTTELEHIRWCRYHYINNWKYGAQRNNEKRIHNCLIPFSELSEEEKLKDVEALKIKMQLDSNKNGKT